MMKRNRLAEKKISLGDYEEYYITLKGKNLSQGELRKLLQRLEGSGKKIISVNIFGDLDKLKKFQDLSLAYPLAAVGNSASYKNTGIESVLVQAVGGKISNFHYIFGERRCIGCCYKNKYGRFLHITVSNDHNFSGEREFFEEELKETYKAIAYTLKKWKFTAMDVYRFWNYMKDISSNYKLFNNGRNHFFQNSGIRKYPAATGVEANLLNGRKINISLEAMNPAGGKKIKIESIRSKLQCEASVYGPKFSRAKIITFSEIEIKNKIYISGTSSISLKGKSIVHKDAEENIRYVVFRVKHLLGIAGVSLSGIVSSRLYFKNKYIYNKFLKVYQKEKWNFPFNPLFANICRSELLFEMECIAFGQAGQKKRTIRKIPTNPSK
jgi:enamine deaminase RidA (YjgF/YER057c/UK114 family)